MELEWYLHIRRRSPYIKTQILSDFLLDFIGFVTKHSNQGNT